MVIVGLKLGVAERKTQTNPLSYGITPSHKFTIQLMFKLSDWLKILNYIPNFLTNR